MASKICLQCKKKPKRAKYQFCSKACTKKAAAKAPGFLKCPKNHIMYRDVEKKFKESWKGGRRPRIRSIYLATWSPRMRKTFDDYRAKVERRGKFSGRKNKKGKKMSAGNEKKLFRGALRACGFGDKTMKPCKRSSCKLCETLRAGFKPYLTAKQKTGTGGTRLGAGLYTSKTSSKAYGYAQVAGGVRSRVRILMSCRVVVGRPYDTVMQAPYKKAPPGYDSVYGKPGFFSMFADDEYVVYTPDAIRVAYILVLS